MSCLPFATVLTVGLAFPWMGMAQSFNPLWAVPSTALYGCSHPRSVAPAPNPSPRASFFAGVAGYGPQLKAVAAPPHTVMASALPESH